MATWEFQPHSHASDPSLTARLALKDSRPPHFARRFLILCVFFVRCDVVYDDALLPALTETLSEACCTLPTREGKRPCLCVSHQKRNRQREDSFFDGLARRLGGGKWSLVHQKDDLSVLIFKYLETGEEQRL